MGNIKQKTETISATVLQSADPENPCLTNGQAITQPNGKVYLGYQDSINNWHPCKTIDIDATIEENEEFEEWLENLGDRCFAGIGYNEDGTNPFSTQLISNQKYYTEIIPNWIKLKNKKSVVTIPCKTEMFKQNKEFTGENIIIDFTERKDTDTAPVFDSVDNPLEELTLKIGINTSLYGIDNKTNIPIYFTNDSIIGNAAKEIFTARILTSTINDYLYQNLNQILTHLATNEQKPGTKTLALPSTLYGDIVTNKLSQHNIEVPEGYETWALWLQANNWTVVAW